MANAPACQGPRRVIREDRADRITRPVQTPNDCPRPYRGRTARPSGRPTARRRVHAWMGARGVGVVRAPGPPPTRVMRARSSSAPRRPRRMHGAPPAAGPHAARPARTGRPGHACMAPANGPPHRLVLAPCRLGRGGAARACARARAGPRRRACARQPAHAREIQTATPDTVVAPDIPPPHRTHPELVVVLAVWRG